MNRLWSKVDVGLCWEWAGAIDRRGYGRFALERKNRLAHRVVWEMLVGEVPEGLTLDHLCRNRRCVNPDHLEPVTARENQRRGASGAQHRAKTHCPHGHPYAVYGRRSPRTPNKRWCVACKRQRARQRRALYLEETL